MKIRSKTGTQGTAEGARSARLNLRFVSLFLMLALNGTAIGHDPGPDHGCRLPDRPPDDQDDLRWNSYLAAVDAYRSCINEFAQANRQASRLHNEAANAAVSDWNVFVKDQLNVPEDFPWPPE